MYAFECRIDRYTPLFVWGFKFGEIYSVDVEVLPDGYRYTLTHLIFTTPMVGLREQTDMNLDSAFLYQYDAFEEDRGMLIPSTSLVSQSRQINNFSLIFTDSLLFYPIEYITNEEVCLLCLEILNSGAYPNQKMNLNPSPDKLCDARKVNDGKMVELNMRVGGNENEYELDLIECKVFSRQMSRYSNVYIISNFDNSNSVYTSTLVPSSRSSESLPNFLELRAYFQDLISLVRIIENPPWE